MSLNQDQTYTIEIIDTAGNITTQELKGWQLEILQQNNVQFTSKEDIPVEIPLEIQSILTAIENGDYEVPQYFIDVEVVNIKNGNITAERFRRQWNQGLTSGRIKSTIGTQIHSYNYSTPYGTFTTQATTEQEAQEQKEQFVQEQQAIEQQAIQEQQQQQPEVIEQVVQEEQLPEEEIQNMEINSNSVLIKGQAFEIEQGEIRGTVILEKVQGLWNPYYNGIPLTLVVQYSDVNLDTALETPSTFSVTFPKGFGIETIQKIPIHRSVQFDMSSYKRVRVKIFLWTSLDNPDLPFADGIVFDLDADNAPIDILPPKPKVKSNNFLGTATGVFAGLTGISLLLMGSKKFT